MKFLALCIAGAILCLNGYVVLGIACVIIAFIFAKKAGLFVRKEQ